jgi:hypothetical protein
LAGRTLEDEMADASKPNPSQDRETDPPRVAGQPARKELSGAALRALAEAQQRRDHPAAPLAPEIDGRGGLEPVRYQDWEVKGLATDF